MKRGVDGRQFDIGGLQVNFARLDERSKHFATEAYATQPPRSIVGLSAVIVLAYQMKALIYHLRKAWKIASIAQNHRNDIRLTGSADTVQQYLNLVGPLVGRPICRRLMTVGAALRARSGSGTVGSARGGNMAWFFVTTFVRLIFGNTTEISALIGCLLRVADVPPRLAITGT